MQTSTQGVKTDLMMCCQTRQKQVQRTLWQRRQKNPKLWRNLPRNVVLRMAISALHEEEWQVDRRA